MSKKHFPGGECFPKELLLKGEQAALKCRTGPATKEQPILPDVPTSLSLFRTKQGSLNLIYMKKSKKTLTLSLPEESWSRLTALANGQQKSLENIIETALDKYSRREEKGAADSKIDPIKDREPAKSWGYNSDVKGK